MKKLLPLFFLFFITVQSFGQLIPITMPKKHGGIYLLAGYNRNWFAKSDLHFQGSGYDFSLQGARADDRWKLHNTDEWNVYYPQFSFGCGYLFQGDSKIAIEANYDNVNYVIRNGQKVHLTGNINDEEIEKDTILNKQTFSFKQSNGSGLLTLSLVNSFEFLSSRRDVHVLQVSLKVGGGVPLSHASVRLFDQNQTNDKKVTGYALYGGVSLKYIFAYHLILEGGVKGAYINYSKVNTIANGEVSQILMPFQAIASIGYFITL